MEGKDSWITRPFRALSSFGVVTRPRKGRDKIIMITKPTHIRMPEWLKKAIKDKYKNLSKFIIEACIEKLNKKT